MEFSLVQPCSSVHWTASAAFCTEVGWSLKWKMFKPKCLNQGEVFFLTHTKNYAMAMLNDEQLVVCKKKGGNANLKSK